MVSRHLGHAAFFLMTLAAFSLALGQPRLALAAGEGGISRVEKIAETSAGKAALANAGISPRKFKAVIEGLSPQQRQQIAALARKSELASRMIAEGYTPAEASQRLALFTDAEIARLGDDPAATAPGTGVGTIGVVICVLAAVAAILAYFGDFEPVGEGEKL